MKNWFEIVTSYLELCKVNLSFFSALSAATGFMLAAAGVRAEIIVPLAGVFLLACGSCALNQYQERNTDAVMERTKKRPLPSGRVAPHRALLFALMLMLSGSLIFFYTGSLSAHILGASAVLLYNGVYTNLKRKTAYASVPCAVIGAIPPAIGWTLGGGEMADTRLIALCFLFYIWQITHFLFLFLSHGNDYEKAGFPSLTQSFSERQLERIAFVWIIATAVACLITPLYGLMSSSVISFILIAITVWLVWNGIPLARGSKKSFAHHVAFRKINLYILLIMLLISIDRARYVF